MLQNSGVELNKTQLFDAVKCYGQLLGVPNIDPQNIERVANQQDVNSEKQKDKDLPGKIPEPIPSQGAKVRKKSPSGFPGKQEKDKGMEIKSGKLSNFKEIGIQENMMSTTIFHEDYHIQYYFS